jgi:ABC-type branched-subunit amino acid transport system substrate-binding protein
LGLAVPTSGRGVPAVNGKTVKGPDGKEIEIQYVYRDNASAGPDKTKQLAEDLVLREKVKFLAGFDLSPHAMAVADIATQAKVPVIIMNAATASITRGSPYYVRVSMTIPQYVSPLPKWAYDHGIKKVYMLVSDYAPGYDAETYFAKGFKAVGGEIVGSVRMPQQETNYAAYMEKVLQAKPDAIFISSPGFSLDRVRESLHRARPQGGGHQAARHRRNQGIVPAELHRRRHRGGFGVPLHRDQHQPGEHRAAQAAGEDVRRESDARYCLGRRLGRH